MNNRQLRCFISAAKLNSISEAANHLPMSPSTIAKKIVSLEEELGVALFERLPRGVKLTPAGEVWYQHAHQILNEVAQASSETRRASQNMLLKRLDIGIPSLNLTGATVLDEIIENFSASNSNVNIVIHKILLRQQQIDALRRGVIHIAFNTSFQESPDIVIDKFAQENVWLVVGDEHPLATASTVHIDVLNKYPVIDFQETSMKILYESAFGKHNIAPRFENTASDVFSHLGLCACGKGITLLSPGFQRLRFPGVKFIPLISDSSLAISYECARLKKASLPLVDDLVESIVSCNRS
ncbi:MAG: LysR family transcriptional regulator [Rouxiella aceris]|uniref:LysR family transcriptional regulator n=1 Tax=Rouxiella aceris TaxID=2703884 RepID=UPI002842AD85|nr:LysR family transcriptional regulator [Rouxiella aceris]MDR3430765.1 LysR family transcriptional regulator [Rouxiella aceris]